MRRFAKRFVDATVIRLLEYVRRTLPPGRDIELVPRLVPELLRRAIAESADYADAHMAGALGFPDQKDARAYAFGRRAAEGLILEFGVRAGRSINFFAGLTDQPIYGFDSFEGLREDWKGTGHPVGHFDVGGRLPPVPPHVTLIKGWFDAVLPGFLAAHPPPIAFAHIDSDTYEAAATIFRLAADRFVPGTVVMFDEYFGYWGWRMGEFKAWQEFVTQRGLRYEYLCFSDESVAVVIR
jgi:hypothetical protein